MSNFLLVQLLTAMQSVHIPAGVKIGKALATDRTSYGFQVFDDPGEGAVVLTSDGFEPISRARKCRRRLFDSLVDSLYSPEEEQVYADEFEGLDTEGVSTSSDDFVADLEKILDEDPQIFPDGFIPWSGKHELPPGVSAHDKVEVICRGDVDSFSSDEASRFMWLSDDEMPHSTDIVAYRVLESVGDLPDTRSVAIYDVAPEVYSHVVFSAMNGDDVFPSCLPTYPGLYLLSGGSLVSVANPRDYIKAYQKARKPIFETKSEDHSFAPSKIVGFASFEGCTTEMKFWNPASRPGMTTVTPQDVLPTDMVRVFNLARGYRETEAWCIDWSHTSDAASNILAYAVI